MALRYELWKSNPVIVQIGKDDPRVGFDMYVDG